MNKYVEQIKYDAHKGLKHFCVIFFSLEFWEDIDGFRKKEQKKFIDEKLENFYIEQFKVFIQAAAAKKKTFHFITITFDVLSMYV